MNVICVFFPIVKTSPTPPRKLVFVESTLIELERENEWSIFINVNNYYLTINVEIVIYSVFTSINQ